VSGGWGSRLLGDRRREPPHLNERLEECSRGAARGFCERQPGHRVVGLLGDHLPEHTSRRGKLVLIAVQLGSQNIDLSVGVERLRSVEQVAGLADLTRGERGGTRDDRRRLRGLLRLTDAEPKPHPHHHCDQDTDDPGGPHPRNHPRFARARFRRAFASSSTFRSRTACGVTSTHSSSRRNSSA
jgi:hypothetical protein